MDRPKLLRASRHLAPANTPAKTPGDTGAGLSGRVEAIGVTFRTCLGCRKRDSRGSLLRVVLRDGLLCADPRAVEPGRGAWFHLDCAERSLRGLPAALRWRGALDLAPIRTFLAALSRDTSSTPSSTDLSTATKGRK
ncbi:MAG: YlxR family protein [Actinobacteria bacterium]|nr:YlxR family protein [Actinomycetota bacterium]